MRVCYDNVLDEVVLLGLHTDNALAAPVLCGVDIGALALDVACVAYGNYAGVSFNKVLKVDFLGRLGKLGASGISELCLDFKKLVFDNLDDLLLVGKNAAKLVDKDCELCNSVLNLLSFKTGELTKGHLDDCLCLRIGKTKSFDKSFLRVRDRLTRLDNLDDLVDVVDCGLVALENVDFTKCLVKVKLRSSRDNALLEIDISVKD